MEIKDVFIVCFCLTVIGCGYFVNFSQRKKQVKVLFFCKDASLTLFRILVPSALILGIVFHYLNIGSMRWQQDLLGYVLILLGFLLRGFSIWSLGNAFQAQVSLVEGQKLHTDGIYSVIRHPSYTGLLLYYFGFALVLQNWISLFFLVVFPLVAVLFRVAKEELFLKEHFSSSFIQYQKQTKKLFPFIY